MTEALAQVLFDQSLKGYGLYTRERGRHFDLATGSHL
jgi:hypothetical protein